MARAVYEDTRARHKAATANAHNGRSAARQRAARRKRRHGGNRVIDRKRVGSRRTSAGLRVGNVEQQRARKRKIVRGQRDGKLCRADECRSARTSVYIDHRAQDEVRPSDRQARRSGANQRGARRKRRQSRRWIAHLKIVACVCGDRAPAIHSGKAKYPAGLQLRRRNCRVDLCAAHEDRRLRRPVEHDGRRAGKASTGDDKRQRRGPDGNVLRRHRNDRKRHRRCRDSGPARDRPRAAATAASQEQRTSKQSETHTKDSRGRTLHNFHESVHSSNSHHHARVNICTRAFIFRNLPSDAHTFGRRTARKTDLPIDTTHKVTKHVG